MAGAMAGPRPAPQATRWGKPERGPAIAPAIFGSPVSFAGCTNMTI
ncbi:hypothetical protein [Reticulibacter mediterranei]|nr:hypothetical protein [Reticulibacter mediterranei]